MTKHDFKSWVTQNKIRHHVCVLLMDPSIGLAWSRITAAMIYCINSHFTERCVSCSLSPCQTVCFTDLKLHHLSCYRQNYHRTHQTETGLCSDLTAPVNQSLKSFTFITFVCKIFISKWRLENSDWVLTDGDRFEFLQASISRISTKGAMVQFTLTDVCFLSVIEKQWGHLWDQQKNRWLSNRS